MRQYIRTLTKQPSLSSVTSEYHHKNEPNAAEFDKESHEGDISNDSKERLASDLKNFKKSMALQYHDSYSKTVLILYVLVLLKRIITDREITLFDVAMLLLNMSIFYGFRRLFRLNDFTLKYVPYILAIFSYMSHTRFIFAGLFNESQDNPYNVIMKKDQLFRHIIQCTSMNLSIVYICIFIVQTRRDCLIVNSTVGFLFVRDTFRMYQYNYNIISFIQQIFDSLTLVSQFLSHQFL